MEAQRSTHCVAFAQDQTNTKQHCNQCNQPKKQGLQTNTDQQATQQNGRNAMNSGPRTMNAGWPDMPLKVGEDADAQQRQTSRLKGTAASNAGRHLFNGASVRQAVAVSFAVLAFFFAPQTHGH